MAHFTALVGTYTEAVPHAPHAAGPGILTLRVAEDGASLVAKTPPSITGPNPSYLAVRRSASGTVDVFAANEVPSAAAGTVTRLHLHADGSLTRVAQAACGRAPAHVATLPCGGVVAGCFGDGSVATLSAPDASGLHLVDAVKPAHSYGAGWVGVSSVHMALPLRGPSADTLLFVCDPTADRVSLVACDAHKRLSMRAVLHLGDGSYPRHAVQAPDDAGAVYVALAKARAVAVVRVKLDDEVHASLGEERRLRLGGGDGALGAIRTSGAGAVLVSERGAGCDRVWRVGVGGAGGGEAVAVGSGGAVPRDFCVAGGVVLAAHQDDGALCVGREDAVRQGAGGALRKVGVDGASAAVCVVVADGDEG